MTKLILTTAFTIGFCLTSFSQSVVISSKKITYTRPRPFAEFKRNFTVDYPRVRASTAALSKNIENAISYRSVLGLNIQDEIRSVQWLEEAGYIVKHNGDGILTIDLYAYGTAAYPSGITKTVVVDLKTGNRVTPAQVFTNLPGLAALVRQAQQKEIREAIERIKNDPETASEPIEELFSDRRFTIRDLERFSVVRSGVTFTYDYGFPHAIQALAPEGEFTFSWAQLKPYVRSSGLLARFGR